MGGKVNKLRRNQPRKRLKLVPFVPAGHSALLFERVDKAAQSIREQKLVFNFEVLNVLVLLNFLKELLVNRDCVKGNIILGILDSVNNAARNGIDPADPAEADLLLPLHIFQRRMGNDELIHIVRMGADRKIVARAAFKVSDAKVLGCVVIKLYRLIFKRRVE